MGRVVYGGTTLFTADDRSLRHLQIVIQTRLRARQSFPLGWRVPPESGSGHGSAWITPGVPVFFVYGSAPQGPINQDWLRVLMAETDIGGLRLLPEPGAPSPAEER